MIKYDKLFKMLEEKEIKRTLLLSLISSKTLAKLSKGDNVNTDTIDTLCYILDCQPADIMEYVPDKDKMKKDVRLLDKWKQAFNAGLHYYDDMTKEEAKAKPPLSKEVIKDGIEILKEQQR